VCRRPKILRQLSLLRGLQLGSIFGRRMNTKTTYPPLAGGFLFSKENKSFAQMLSIYVREYPKTCKLCQIKNSSIKCICFYVNIDKKSRRKYQVNLYK